jgi:uncharacterized protein
VLSFQLNTRCRQVSFNYCFPYLYMENNDLTENLNLDTDEIKFTEPSAYPDIKSLCWLFVRLVLWMLGVGMILGFILACLDGVRVNKPILISLLDTLGYIVAMLLVLRFAIKKINKQQETPFKVSFAKIQGWLVPVLILSALALVVGLERLDSLIPMPKYVEKFFRSVLKTDIFSMVNIVIAAPLFEEILCRGIVLRGLLKNYAPYKAIIISALFFAAIHLNPWQALPAFFAGLFIGWLYYKTQSIIPGIVVHSVNNLTASLFLFLPQNQQCFGAVTGIYYIPLCIVSALIFVAACVVINKRAMPLER